jgi:hypothetical protein
MKDMATIPKDLKDYLKTIRAVQTLRMHGIRVNVRELTEMIAIIVYIVVGPDI